ncbi:hypothetical protein E2C01_101716 [Portunus trituberculatus]|uniref:Carboxylesterase type B domain-containing protein n=1 Tax=Portunus trituberculatus TaxID=210409 RepID=A0A5B7KGK4_PORTR|nr:hypothetical protein [Portunus trituberculatus]
MLNIPTGCSSSFVAFLFSSSILITLKECFLQEWYDLPLTVGPCVDGSFLPQHPASLLRLARYNDNVDIMTGTVHDEGNLITAGLFSKAGEEALQQLNDNFNKVGPILLGVTNEENPVYLARRVFLRYMSDLNVTMDDEPALTKVSILGSDETH